MTMPILFVAKKEVMDNIRNKWLIVITIIYVSLTIISSLIAAAVTDEGGFEGLKITTQWMMFFLQYIIPIIGLMLGYTSIVGECEKGTMSSLAAHPISRYEIVIGKFLGLGTVLTTSIIIGFGIAGVIIGINVSGVDYGLFGSFIFYSIIVGLAFLSISIFFSSIIKKRSTCMGATVFIWFLFCMIWGFMTLGLVWASKKGFEEVPNIFALNLISPVQAYLGLISVNLGQTPIPSMSLSMAADHFPDFYNTGVLLLTLFVWIIVMLILSIIFFEKRDI